MARRFGSKDSYKRNSENYRGRLPGSKDKDDRDGFSYWLRYEVVRLKKDGWTLDYVYAKNLTGKEKDRYWRYHYLGQLLGIIGRSGRRYRFRVSKVTFMQISLLDDRLYLGDKLLSDAEVVYIDEQNKKTRLWWQKMMAEFEKLEAPK